MGKSATRLPSLSVQNGAWSRSAAKPVIRKWRSSTSAYRTPASARSAASSGSHTRSVSQSPRASTPKRSRTAWCSQWICSTRSSRGSDASTGS